MSASLIPYKFVRHHFFFVFLLVAYYCPADYVFLDTSFQPSSLSCESSCELSEAIEVLCAQSATS